jgi:LCP family protein required for cell wall assembly
MSIDRREWLLVRTAGSGDARIDLKESPLRIGRGPENRVALDDSYASARHAELVDQGGQRCLRDLGSRNGTRLNGQPIEPGSLARLQDGDVIQIGASEVVYLRGQPVGHVTNGFLATDVQPYPEAAPAPVPAPRRGRVGAGLGRFVLRLALLLVVIAMLAIGVTWLLAPSRVTVLVMGSDARPDELERGAVGRTDTLLTVVADRSPSGVAMISLPRDLWVSIPGFGEERINAAYAVGGPTVAERVVGDTLGVHIDRYLLVGLQGVRDIVDAAGGVDIDVDVPIHDDAYPTDDYGTVVVDIPAGHQHMDGETALRYARTRHQDNDFGRMARQQQVIAAVRSALLRPDHWWRVPAVIGAVRRATKTDLGPLDLATLAFSFGTSSSEPDRLAVGLDLVDEFRGGDGAYLLRPKPFLRQRVAAVLSPTSAAVEVLNGTGANGLAAQAADTLRNHQMTVANVGSAPRAQPDTTIEVKPGLTRAGLSAASILGLPRDSVRASTSLSDDVDVRITLGQDWARR